MQVPSQTLNPGSHVLGASVDDLGLSAGGLGSELAEDGSKKHSVNPEPESFLKCLWPGTVSHWAAVRFLTEHVPGGWLWSILAIGSTFAPLRTEEHESADTVLTNTTLNRTVQVAKSRSDRDERDSTTRPQSSDEGKEDREFAEVITNRRFDFTRVTLGRLVGCRIGVAASATPAATRRSPATIGPRIRPSTILPSNGVQRGSGKRGLTAAPKHKKGIDLPATAHNGHRRRNLAFWLRDFFTASWAAGPGEYAVLSAACRSLRKVRP
jgi:hypothetical protein